MKDMTKKIMLIIIGIVLNVSGRFLAQSLHLPIWFDMVGTCVVTYFVGIGGGLAAGIFNSILSGIFDSTAFLYSITSIIAVIALHMFIKKGYLNQIVKVAVASIWIGMICTVVSTPLNLIFYNGYSGNMWGDTLVDMLRWYDVSNILASMAGEAIVEIVDKQICLMLAFAIICVYQKWCKKKMRQVNVVSVVLVMIIGLSCLAQPDMVQAEEKTLFEENFVEEIYNNTNGMVSSEANIIRETDDGCIWIGSYAGLTRFDGKQFEFIREGGLVNVVGMMKDSKGRLWIGTNDAGIARYEQGVYTYFTVEDGLASDSIRCFAEDKDGNVYVGTSEKICKFNTDDKIEILDYEINFVKTMVIHKEMLVVMDNAGCLYVISNGVVNTIKDMKAKELFYYCLAVTSKGLMAGTDTGELFVFDVSEDGLTVQEQIQISAEEISAVFEDGSSRIWIGTESGFGYMDEAEQYHKMKFDSFDSSIDSFYEDYQGNIWIASSRYGVMKLSESQFINLFDKLGLEKTVVNAVTEYNGDYYCGTDKGLKILDGNTFQEKTNELSQLVGSNRVRSFLVDSKNQLWICTYGGLISYDHVTGIQYYSAGTHQLTSERFRCITELKDGTMAAGTADGINLIKDNVVTDTFGAGDGLGNTQILSIVEGNDGTVWAGSDGSGIYVISDGKLIANYTVEDGLSSNVILRIVPYEKGYLVVTSNALCHIDLDGHIRRLKQFPYFNNYDVLINKEIAYITCSAGIYKVNLSTLCEDKGEQFKLYDASEGLLSGLTANSWNYQDADGIIYLCSNDGVIVFKENNETGATDLKYGIVSIICDGQEVSLTGSEHYRIPANAENISIYGSVRNYGFFDAKVRFFVKEQDDNPILYDWNEMDAIQIVKPDLSNYHVCMQILDSSGENLLQETTFTIDRELRMWETSWYRIYLLLVCFEVFIFIIFCISHMVLTAMRKNELEKLQIVLKEKVNEQTEELRLQEKKTKELLEQTITALSEAVDAKDRYTSGHSKRVAKYAQMLAARMGKSKEEQEEIYRAGLLHDVGKIRVPEEIINKNGKLTDEEFSIIAIHPITGYHILRGISGSDYIATGAKYHHEKYNGKGYPNGLAGENIPEVARILGVADAYDAMTSNRSYRDALPQEVVRSEIEKGKGTQFDPGIADFMLEMIDADKTYTMKEGDKMNRTILVVDDEPMMFRMIEVIMRDEPMYQLLHAYSGKEALEILQKEAVDLILLDVNMPELSGLDTLRLIREKYQVPVAVMTGDHNLSTINEFNELGCDDYITKPFQPEVMKELVHNMTERTILE